MNNRIQALVIAGILVSIGAGLSYVFYGVYERRSAADIAVEAQHEVDTHKPEEKNPFTGLYSASEAIEGSGKRFSFIQVAKREGGGFSASAKLDTIGSDTADSLVFACADVTITEKDFFVKCSDPAAGQFSFNGEWQKSDKGLMASGAVLWSKDGTALLDHRVILQHTAD